MLKKNYTGRWANVITVRRYTGSKFVTCSSVSRHNGTKYIKIFPTSSCDCCDESSDTDVWTCGSHDGTCESSVICAQTG